LPSATYTRGEEHLTGSWEGEGGIGGLLSMTLNTVLGSSSSNSMYYHTDANGNVTMLINASQYIVAKYLYDAFGNVLSAAGSFAQQNLYRFSSKEVHINSGLVYYLYRYYDPHLQRWINRDPIAELGGINLYQFVHNDPENYIDPFGLDDTCPYVPQTKPPFYSNWPEYSWEPWNWKWPKKVFSRKHIPPWPITTTTTVTPIIDQEPPLKHGKPGTIIGIQIIVTQP
jgi:RHS repeat-associated protein